MLHLSKWLLTAVVALGVTSASWAQTAKPGTVCNVKVVSDKVPDVTSLDAWKKSFIKDDMKNQDKALAVWRSVVMFQYQDSPPAEFLTHENIVYDPIKMFNVYGYAMCSPHSAHMSALARSIGFQARGWAISHHSVGEFFYDNAWHHLDSSLIAYFLKEDGTIASIGEITAAVQEFYKTHPEFNGLDEKARDKKLREFEKTDQRQGWKLNGPKLIANSPCYDTRRGWWPAGTHGWYATMQCFDGTSSAGKPAYLYEYGASMGYQVNVQLRPGEKLVRNWGNEKMHINQEKDAPKNPGCLEDKEGFLKSAQAFMDKQMPEFPNLTNGRIGNGKLDWNVPVSSADLKNSCMTFENLSSTKGLRVIDAKSDGVMVIRMPSSYVYLGGSVKAKAVLGQGGSILVELSDNNGLNWKEAGKIAAGEQTIDLSSLIRRRYDYRLRFTIKGEGTGLDSLLVTQDIQHSQRALPALDKGDNKITFSAGRQESTITAESAFKADAGGKQVTHKDLQVKLDNVDEKLSVKNNGTVTVPVATPGEITRVRFGGAYRAWGDTDKIDLEISFDGGKTFKKVAEGAAQKGGCTVYTTVKDVPPGTKAVQARYVGTSKAGLQLGSFRVDADYKDPNFGFRPVKVTYVYEEDGKPKEFVHVAKTADETFVIKCASRPVMKSLTVELAD